MVFCFEERSREPRARRPCHVAWASRPCQRRLVPKQKTVGAEHDAALWDCSRPAGPFALTLPTLSYHARNCHPRVHGSPQRGQAPSRYMTKRNKKTVTERIEKKKYNPFLRRHTCTKRSSRRPRRPVAGPRNGRWFKTGFRSPAVSFSFSAGGRQPTGAIWPGPSGWAGFAAATSPAVRRQLSRCCGSNQAARVRNRCRSRAARIPAIYGAGSLPARQETPGKARIAYEFARGHGSLAKMKTWSAP